MPHRVGNCIQMFTLNTHLYRGAGIHKAALRSDTGVHKYSLRPHRVGDMVEYGVHNENRE